MNFRLIQQALVALEMYRECTPEGNGVAEQAIVALKQFKKEWEETEMPYVVVECNCSGKTTLFSPPQRKPLTREQIVKCQEEASDEWCGVEELFVLYARAIEAAHGIKE